MTDGDGTGRAGPLLSRRRLLGAALLVALVALVTAGWGLHSALEARRQLMVARTELADAKTRLADLEMEAANRALGRAHHHFSMAAERMNAPAMTVLGLLPVGGANVDVVREMAEGGRDVSGAAATVAAVIRDEGGLDAFAPRDGRIPVTAMQRLHRPLRDAADAMRASGAAVGATPTTGLLPDVADARMQFLSELSDAQRQLHPVATITGALPTFLGAHEPRRYLLAAQNPAELRGTGGFMGAFAMLEVTDGRLSIGDFRPIQDLPNVPVTAVAAPDPQFAARYDRFGGAGNWRNINFTAHFPWVGEAATTLYAQSGGGQVDGVIAVDPHALAALLEATGPVPAPTGGDIDADDVVEYVTNEAYDPLQPTGERKELLGQVATTAFRTLMRGGVADDPRGMLEALGGIATQGHLLLYSAHPTEQSAFVALNVAGVQQTVDGDYLSVVVNNMAANKTDFYTDRTVRYAIALQPDGSGVASLEVRFDNDAPTDGKAKHVIGPNLTGLRAGDNRTLVTAFCALSCSDVSGGDVHRERGLTGASQVVRIASGETGSAHFSWTVNDAWTPSADGGRYRLLFENQVTLRPTDLRVEVTAPPGLTFAAAGDGSTSVSGDTARWQGEPSGQEILELRFVEAAR